MPPMFVSAQCQRRRLPYFQIADSLILMDRPGEGLEHLDMIASEGAPSFRRDQILAAGSLWAALLLISLGRHQDGETAAYSCLRTLSRQRPWNLLDVGRAWQIASRRRLRWIATGGAPPH